MTNQGALQLLRPALFIFVVAAHCLPGPATGQASIPGEAIRSQIVFGSLASGELDPPDGLDGSSKRIKKSWFSFDKVQHVTFGFLFTVGYQYALVNKLNMTESRALPVSILGTAAVGLGKELIDWKYRSAHHFSKGDLAADSVGILLAVGLILL